MIKPLKPSKTTSSSSNFIITTLEETQTRLIVFIPPGSLELRTTNLLVGQKGIRYRCAFDWNAILKELARIHPVSATDKNWFEDLSSHQLKPLLKKLFLSNY